MSAKCWTNLRSNHLLQSKLFFELYQDKSLENMMTIAETKKRREILMENYLNELLALLKQLIFNLRNT